MHFKPNQTPFASLPESGIIADISLSPDEALENPLWPQQQQKYHTLLKKSHSVASTSQEHNHKPNSTEDNTNKPKPIELQLSSNNNNHNASSASLSSGTNTTNASSDTITVHLWELQLTRIAPILVFVQIQNTAADES